MEITEVKVFPVKEEKLKAFVSIVLDECFMVNDIKVIRGRDGHFISMPSRRKRNGKFKDIAHPLNNETRQRMERRILEEYERVAAGSQERGGEKQEKQAESIASKERRPQESSEPEAAADDRSLDEVAEEHLRDSFWET